MVFFSPCRCDVVWDSWHPSVRRISVGREGKKYSSLHKICVELFVVFARSSREFYKMKGVSQINFFLFFWRCIRRAKKLFCMRLWPFFEHLYGKQSLNSLDLFLMGEERKKMVAKTSPKKFDCCEARLMLAHESHWKHCRGRIRRRRWKLRLLLL